MNKEQIKDEIKATIVSEMEHNLRMGFDGSYHDYLLGLADFAHMFLDASSTIVYIDAIKEVYEQLDNEGLIK